MSRFLRNIILIVVCLTGFSIGASAQFKEEAFSQTYVGDSTSTKDTSTYGIFSFKELTRGLAHKETMRLSTMFGGSVVVPGISQIYNRDYWKIPVAYAGMGVCAGLGGHYVHKYRQSKIAYKEAFALDPTTTVSIDNNAKTMGTCLLVGAGLFYWGQLMDGVFNYDKDGPKSPSKATIYAILLPGLGQAYNGEYWKIPIYWAGLIGSAHYYSVNKKNFKRFRWIYNAANEDGYDGPISASTAQYYRNLYRRYRDYSVVAICLFYLLQVIDANVFAYMGDFEMNDDISMSIEPAVIAPDNAYALQFGGPQTTSSVGLRFGLRF